MQMNAEYQLVIILKNRKKKKRQFQNLLHVANYVARGKLTNHKSQNNPSKWQNLTKQKSGCCWIERKDMNFEQKWRREEGGGGEGYTWNWGKEAEDVHKTTIIEIIDGRWRRRGFIPLEPLPLFLIIFFFLLLVFHHRHVMFLWTLNPRRASTTSSTSHFLRPCLVFTYQGINPTGYIIYVYDIYFILFYLFNKP